MTRDLIIGIDAGTSMSKAVAFDLEGAQLAVASLPNSYDELPGGAVEQDLARTWDDTVRVLRLLAAKVDGLAERTTAVAVTGQGDGTWLVDAAGEPVGKGWLWLDSRAARITDELRRNGGGARTYDRTGCGLNTCQQGVQLAWLAQHRPDVVERAATAFHCKDWLYLKLTGERVTDPSEGTFTFGDFRERRYADEILDVLGIPQLRHLLPPMVEGAERHHKLSRAAAAQTGLMPGTPVVLGYVDVVCTALGGGIYEKERTVGCSIVGTTGMHVRFAHDLDEVRLNQAQTGYTMCFPVPGTYAQMQSNMAATLNIDWLVERAAEVLAAFGEPKGRKELLPLIDAKVAAAEPGSVLFHPFIYEAGERGPFVDPLARAQFLGLSMRTGYFDLMRAVYEGLCFAARDCYAAMGHRPDEIRLTGGAARSPTLRRILASVLGRPVRTSQREEAGAAGAAMMAAVCLRHFPDMAACAAAWVTPLLGRAQEPEPGLAQRYDALFPIYQDAYRRSAATWQALHQMRSEARA